MSEELSVRVERGAAWLDETRPGWWREVDLATLDLGSSCRCVLGQVFEKDAALRSYNGFDYVVYKVGPHREYWPEDHGFDFDLYRYGEGADAYAALDELWISAVKARFEAGSL